MPSMDQRSTNAATQEIRAMTSRPMTTATGPQTQVNSGERGASLIEYALLVGAITVVLIGAVKVVGNHSSESTAAAATAMSTPSGAGNPAPEGGGDGDGGGGSGGGGGAATTTTTSTAPTPTTSPPTPTTAPEPEPTSGSVGLEDVTVARSGSNWTAETTVSIVDDTGQPVAGATVEVTVRYRERQWYGYEWQEESVQVETGADGTADLGAGPYKRSGSGSVDEIEFVVESAQLPDDLEWDQAVQTVGADAP
jgi:Flp pilus assembly pilin Flp